MKQSLNSKGVTLIELTVSILIASMLIAMLMSLLTMALNAKAGMDVRNRMSDESFVISEVIRNNMLELGTQEIEVMEQDPEGLTVIEIRHLVDFVLNELEEIVADTSNAQTDLLMLNLSDAIITHNGIDVDPWSIYYNDERLNTQNITILTNSEINLLSVSPVACGYSGVACEDAVLRLNLILLITMPNGVALTESSKPFITTIIT